MTTKHVWPANETSFRSSQPARSEPQFDAKLRAPEEADTRLKMRRVAEVAKTEVEFKPCQNAIDYQLTFKTSSLKN